MIDAGAEVNAHSMHVALLALESIGAIARIGHGFTALYAASRSLIIPAQMLHQQEGELILKSCQTLSLMRAMRACDKIGGGMTMDWTVKARDRCVHPHNSCF